MPRILLNLCVLLIGLLFNLESFAQTVTSSRTYGDDKWIGHVYDGRYLNGYKGYFERTEEFIDRFGGSRTNFTVNTLAGGINNVYTETFSVQYRMHTTKKGCYMLDTYGDDGIRLKIDGSLVFNRWVDQGPTSYNNILIHLNGDNNMIFEYYENGGGNVVAFRNFIKLTNEITSDKELVLYSDEFIDDIRANGLSSIPSSITHSYAWQYKLEGGSWNNVISANTETSCSISGISNSSNVDKVYYFRRQVHFRQAAKWGVSSKDYIENSDEVKVILKAVPDVSSGSTYGEDMWIGHVYSNKDLTNYMGVIYRSETFLDEFGGSDNNFNVSNSSGGTSPVRTETFSVNYRMHSTKSGCYMVNFHGDDGIRLNIDGDIVFNRWKDQSPKSYDNVLINLDGDSNMNYDFYENSGGNVVAFRELIKLNVITSDKEISMCPGDVVNDIRANGLSITGSTISHSYVWQYKEDGGVWKNVIGANTETSCSISGITNSSDEDKVFYFRRQVVFGQVAKWGASVKNYIDNSEIVKVKIGAVPSVQISGGDVCLGNEIISFSATKSGVYNVSLYDGTESYTITGVNQDQSIGIRTHGNLKQYSIVLTNVQKDGGCAIVFTSGNEPESAKASIDVVEEIITKSILKNN